MKRLGVFVIGLVLLSIACSLATAGQPTPTGIAATARPAITPSSVPTEAPSPTPTAIPSPTPEPNVRLELSTLSQVRFRWSVREAGPALDLMNLACEDPACPVVSRIGGYAFSPDGGELAVGVCRGDLTENRSDRKHPRFACPDGGEVRRYAVADGELLGSAPMDGFPLAIAWNPKSGLLAAGSADGEIDVWNLSTAEPAQQFQHPFVFSGVTSLLFGSDGSQLISEGDGKVVVWDWAAGTALKTMEGDGPMSLSPSGQELVTGWYSSATANTTIRIFDLARLGRSRDIRPRFVQPNMMDRTIKAAFTQSGSQILILASNGAEWWDSQTLQFQGSTDVLKLISEKTDAFSPIGAVTSGGLVLTEPGIGVSIAGFPLPLLSLGPATCGFALWDPVHAGAYAIPASSGPCESAIAAGDSHRVVLSSDDRVLAADDGAGDLRVWSVDPSAAVVAPICLGDCGGS